ncbi:MAG TPA: patatin-like phospholipase family protein [Polyangiaceae bacterium]|jgi:predicted acylesterase/phospholipase RssA
MSDALVLAGGVAKGAFTAGALAVLSDPATKARVGLDVSRIVGASSGALNGVFYAAAIRGGTEAFAGQRLAQVWLDDASVSGAFDFSLRDIVKEIGLSTDSKLLSILRRNIRPGPGAAAPIELRLVVANADGEPMSTEDGGTATTFEHLVDLTGPDFDTTEALERVFLATAASAALPGAYAPVPLDVDGRTFRGLDGGLVDDAPLGHALEGAPGITRILVIVPSPRLRTEPADLHGLALASHVFDILVEERLVRDLRNVARVNRLLTRLPSLVADASERAALLDELGWAQRKPVEIVEIRPEAELSGDGFSGFRSLALRQSYVDAGKAAAQRWVDTV